MGLEDRDYMRGEDAAGWSFVTPHRDSIIIKLIAVNVIIFLAHVFTRSTLNINGFLALHVPEIAQAWRFFTYMFTHSGPGHIFFNMWILYLFGVAVEERVGVRHFIWLYCIGGLFAGGIWLLTKWNSHEMLLGASAAVWAVQGAALLLMPQRVVVLLFFPIRIQTLIVITVLIDVVMLFNQNSSIAHIAHLAGFAAGLVYTKTRLMPRRVGKKSFFNPFAKLSETLRQRQKAKAARPHTVELSFVDEDEPATDDEIMSTEIDPILDKIGEHGMRSLTRKERKILDRARYRMKE